MSRSVKKTPHKGFISSLLLISLCLSCSPKQETKAITYGSNNGEYLTINGTRMYYEEYGKGAPLLLLHGGMGSIADFEKCIPGLSERYRVIAPDTPGHGRSELADSLSYELIAAYISQLMDSLKLDSTYIMGWSDGAITALLLADKKPNKVRKVIAVGANYNLTGFLPPDADFNMVKPDPIDEWEKKNRHWIENYVRVMPRDWKKFKADIDKLWYQDEYFPKSVLERISVPVIIALGDTDEIRLEHGIEMHRLIKNSQFCVLPGTTHAVFKEKPELINTIALDFFEQN
jgi:pimeloyl-ACP methyl ester carboxylesterase